MRNRRRRCLKLLSAHVFCASRACFTCSLTWTTWIFCSSLTQKILISFNNCGIYTTPYFVEQKADTNKWKDRDIPKQSPHFHVQGGLRKAYLLRFQYRKEAQVLHSSWFITLHSFWVFHFLWNLQAHVFFISKACMPMVSEDDCRTHDKFEKTDYGSVSRIQVNDTLFLVVLSI